MADPRAWKATVSVNRERAERRQIPAGRLELEMRPASYLRAVGQMIALTGATNAFPDESEPWDVEADGPYTLIESVRVVVPEPRPAWYSDPLSRLCAPEGFTVRGTFGQPLGGGADV